MFCTGTRHCTAAHSWNGNARIVATIHINEHWTEHIHSVPEINGIGHLLLKLSLDVEHDTFCNIVYIESVFSALTLLAGRQEEDLACKKCLKRGADCLHMVQLMTLLPKTPSPLASFKSRQVLPCWYWKRGSKNGCSSSSIYIDLNGGYIPAYPSWLGLTHTSRACSHQHCMPQRAPGLTVRLETTGSSNLPTQHSE